MIQAEISICEEKWKVGFSNDEVGRIIGQLIKKRILFNVVAYEDKITIDVNGTAIFDDINDMMQTFEFLQEAKEKFGKEAIEEQ